VTEVAQCLSCGEEARGFSWMDLSQGGWERHHARGEVLYLCGGCGKAYEEARKLDKIPTREET
jgi:hypothetical protein